MMFLPRNASEMTIMSTPSSRMGILEQVSVQYKVAGGDVVASFMIYFQEVSTFMILAEDTSITLTVPYFCLFVTGDLSFYVDSLGKSKSCSYWLMYCILTHLQWNDHNAERGELWTEERATYIRLNVLRHRTVPSAERMGIASLSHYRSITIDMYLPPLLHGHMGMINTGLDVFGNFIKRQVEPIGQDEQDARKAIKGATTSVEDLMKKRDLQKIILSNLLQFKRKDISNIRKELKKVTEQASKTDLLMQLALASNQKKAFYKELVDNNKHVQSSNVTLKQLTIRLAELEKQRGKPSHSIVQGVGAILSKYGAERESYHGGELNGKSCKEVGKNAFEIMMEVTQLLLRKKNIGGGIRCGHCC
jgi:hypothetical protein